MTFSHTTFVIVLKLTTKFVSRLMKLRAEKRKQLNYDITGWLVIDMHQLTFKQRCKKFTINPGPKNNTCKRCILTALGLRLTIFIAVSDAQHFP